MNNFDQSSSGVNLDLSCFRDVGLSTMYFEDEFSNIWYNQISLLEDRYWNVNLFLFHGTEIKEYDLLDLDNYDLNSGTKADLVGYFIGNVSDCIIDIATFKKLLKSEMIEDLMTNLYYEADQIKFLRSVFNSKYDVVSTRGYSQGDYVEIVIPQTLSFKPSYEYLSNLCWDCPITCRLAIDDEDFYLDEHLDNIYAWDKDKAMAIFKKELADHKKSDYILKWLDNNLPEYPDYY